MSELNAAAQYRQMMASREPEIVDLILPSTFVFRFEKPSTFGLIFGERKELPTATADEAVIAWKEQGVTSPTENTEDVEPNENQIKSAKRAYDIVDEVCRLSYAPKIVLGEPTSDNEINYKEIAPADLEYIYKWVGAGGSSSLMMAMFPERRKSNSVASTNGKKFRTTSK